MVWTLTQEPNDVTNLHYEQRQHVRRETQMFFAQRTAGATVAGTVVLNAVVIAAVVAIWDPTCYHETIGFAIDVTLGYPRSLGDRLFGPST
jgi:hypothetical protein